MTPNYDLELKSALEIATAAGDIVLSYYRREVEVKRKNGEDFNFVTSADLASDALIRSEISRRFPDDRILSEESSDIPSAWDGRVWMVDPLDGTKDFVNGGTRFSVMIGLCVDGAPVVGAVVAPAAGVTYWAARGAGAYRSSGGAPTRLAVSLIGRLEDSRMVTRIPHGESRPSDGFIEAIECREKIQDASVGLKLGRIAAGEAEFAVNSQTRASKWDTCAPQAILEEAGGLVTDFDGAPLDYRSQTLNWRKGFVASNGPILQAKVIRRIRGLEKLV